jgi:DNA-binding NtrC family response regulator
VNRILICEDDEPLREALCEALLSLGFEVREAGSTQEACRAAEIERLDAVISDVHMRGNGHTVVTGMRDIQPGVPVIIITGVDNAEERQRALDGGAFDYLVKPITLERLTTTLARALGSRSGGNSAPPSVAA